MKVRKIKCDKWQDITVLNDVNSHVVILKKDGKMFSVSFVYNVHKKTYLILTDVLKTTK